jgi:hypothetical protein
LAKERENLKKSVDKTQHDAQIIVRDKVMPNTILRIGDHSLKILNVIKAPFYRIKNNRLLRHE